MLNNYSGRRKLKLFVYVVSALLLTIQAAGAVVHTDSILILAKPRNITFKIRIADLPEHKNKEGWIQGEVYAVRLTDVKVLKGRYNKNYIDVDLMVTHKESFTKATELLVYVKFDKQGNVSSVDWWNTFKFACVDLSDIKELSLSEVFNDGYEIDGGMCINIYFYE